MNSFCSLYPEDPYFPYHGPEDIEIGSGVVSEQPDRGENQITSPDEISSGDLIREHGRDHELMFEVWKLPYAEEGDSQLQIAVLDFKRGLSKGWLDRKFLSDVAVEPYDHGKWNRHNWLEKVHFEPSAGFRVGLYDQAHKLAPTAETMLRGLGVYRGVDKPHLMGFYALEPSAFVAMTVQRLRAISNSVRRQIVLHAYYRGKQKSEQWVHTGSKKEAKVDPFESAEISRAGGRVKMSTTWKIVGGESKTHSFTFDEPALDMSVM
jgi:hypothetical protein